MKQEEAADLVASMAARYPGATFTPDNAASYEREFMRLERDRVAAALDELMRTHKFIPAIAEIHQEIVSAKREEARKASVAHPQPITDVSGRTLGPRPGEWREPLQRMISDAERYERMARKWYADKGKPYPGDPGAGFVQLAVAGARGDDIGSALQGALASMVAPGGRYGVD